MKAYTKLLASLVFISGAYGAPAFANTPELSDRTFRTVNKVQELIATEKYSDAISKLNSALGTCQLAAQDLGLRIAIETHGAISPGPVGEAIHQSTVTTDRAALMRLLREIPSAIGINYDPGNIKAAENHSSRLHLDLLDSRINYCHLKDWKRVGRGWEACGVGDDDLNYPALLSQMRFDGVYLIEYEPLHDTTEGIRRSLNTLRSAGFRLAFE